MRQAASTWRPWLLLTLGLLLVVLPRFNRNPLLIDRPAADDIQYRLYVEYFRGADVADELRAASTWRPLTPFLASLLPFRPMTALNVVNVVALWMALFYLYRILGRLRLSRRAVWTGCALFVFSFPTFYYGAIGYVDPVLIALLALGTHALLAERWVRLGFMMVVGTLAKEGIVILVVPVLAYLWMQGRLKTQFYLPLMYAALYLGFSALIRLLAPGTYNVLVWTPAVERFLRNAVEPRAWLSSVLTFGLPGLFAAATLTRLRSFPLADRPYLVTLAAGCAAAVGTWLLAFLSASVDGRTLWAMYPFAIPLAMYGLDRQRWFHRLGSPASVSSDA